MTVRRVVTGHDGEGRARLVDDRVLEPITSEAVPGFEAYGLWGRDERATFRDDGSEPCTIAAVAIGADRVHPASP